MERLVTFEASAVDRSDDLSAALGRRGMLQKPYGRFPILGIPFREPQNCRSSFVRVYIGVPLSMETVM